MNVRKLAKIEGGVSRASYHDESSAEQGNEDGEDPALEGGNGVVAPDKGENQPMAGNNTAKKRGDFVFEQNEGNEQSPWGDEDGNGGDMDDEECKESEEGEPEYDYRAFDHVEESGEGEDDDLDEDGKEVDYGDDPDDEEGEEDEEGEQGQRYERHYGEDSSDEDDDDDEDDKEDGDEGEDDMDK